MNRDSGQVEGQDTLAQHRRVWESKPVLSRLYADQFFRRLDTWAPGNAVLEVGAGPGFYKEHRPQVVALDIVPTPWIDVCADCLALPVSDGALDAVVGLDVIHHLVDPISFLREVERTLRPGGRLALIEPWRTPLSKVVYSRFHQEDFDLSWNPAGDRAPTGDKPFEGNQAIPFLLFDQHWMQVAAQVPGLQRIQMQPFSGLTYILSGGFKDRSLLPNRLYQPLARLEYATLPAWRRVGALRALVVLERV